jgi:ABC-2 type transport system ATP-binding protein
MAEHAVRLRDVTVYYGAVRALNAFDLDIPRQGVHGLLGRNGAGKTTAIRALAGLLHLSSGTVEIFGSNPGVDPRAKRKLSILFSEDGLVNALTVIENLTLWCGFYGLSSGDALERAMASLDAFGIKGKSKTPVKDLSTGNRRAVALARVFAIPTEVVVLDEPTSSLDPVKASEVRSMIRIAAGDRTVLLSTHNLGEAQTLCDTVTMVHLGRKVLSGDLASLTSSAGYSVRTEDGRLRFRGRILTAGPEGFVHIEECPSPPELLADLVREGNRITEFRPAGKGLEEVFLGLAGEEAQ